MRLVWHGERLQDIFWIFYQILIITYYRYYSVTHYHFLMIFVSVQHDLYLNVFSLSRHLFVPLVARFGIVAWVTQLLLEMLCFCVLILAGNSMSLLKGKLVSKMPSFCHICMIRLLIVTGVQLSYYWISWISVKVHLFLSFQMVVLFCFWTYMRYVCSDEP